MKGETKPPQVSSDLPRLRGVDEEDGRSAKHDDKPLVFNPKTPMMRAGSCTNFPFFCFVVAKLTLEDLTGEGRD